MKERKKINQSYLVNGGMVDETKMIEGWKMKDKDDGGMVDERQRWWREDGWKIKMMKGWWMKDKDDEGMVDER